MKFGVPDRHSALSPEVWVEHDVIVLSRSGYFKLFCLEGVLSYNKENRKFQMNAIIKRLFSWIFFTSAVFFATVCSANTVHNVNAGVVSVSSLGASDGIASLFIDVRLKSEWQTYYKSSEKYDTHMKLLWPEELEDKVSFYDIDWPPYIERDYYGEQIKVYRDQVLIPVSVTFENYDDVPEELEFELEIFFCSNVCMKENLPVKVEL